MFELVYCSTARPNMRPEDIENILKLARGFNFKNNITGCLLYHNDEFLQILEGEKDAVQELYASIKKDERHSAVIRLHEGEKKERLFPQWNMAYHNLNCSQLMKNDFEKNFSALSDLSKKPTHAVELFWEVAKLILKN
ncbi:MAG: BLUF domain-containing protein [Crocinitomicaceae bacterium]